MIENNSLGSIMGAPALGPDDEKVGTVGQVFVHPQTGTPTWATVHTGLFGRHETFVPLGEATFDRESLHLPYDKETIKEAPRIDTDEALTPESEAELYRYYGITPDVPDAAPTTEPSRKIDRDHGVGAGSAAGVSSDSRVGSDSGFDADSRVDHDRNDSTVQPDLHESLVDTSPANAYDRHPDPDAAAAGADYSRETRMQQGEASDTIAADDDSSTPHDDGPRHRA